MLINLTPHALNIHTPHGVLDLPASGEIARVDCTRKQMDDIMGVPSYVVTYGDLQGFPDLDPGNVYVVSKMVAAAIVATNAYPGITFVSPGNLLRNDAGQPIGCDGVDLVR